MKKTIKISCALACGAIIALCGYSLKKNNIVVEKQVLTTKKECINAFGKNGKRLLKGKRKLFPFKITVKNNTNKNIVFIGTSLKTAPQKIVVAKLTPLLTHFATGLALGLGTIITSFALSCASFYYGSNIAIAAVAIPTLALSYQYKDNFLSTKNYLSIKLKRKKSKKMIRPMALAINEMTSAIVPGLLSCFYSLILAPFVTIKYFFRKMKKSRNQTKYNFFKYPIIKADETQSFFLFVKQSEYEEKPFSLIFKNIENESELFTVTV